MAEYTGNPVIREEQPFFVKAYNSLNTPKTAIIIARCAMATSFGVVILNHQNPISVELNIAMGLVNLGISEQIKQDNNQSNALL